MFDLFKREKHIGTYKNTESAKAIAWKMRGDERAQRFTIKGPRSATWEAMLPAKGQGRVRWRRVR